MISGFFSGETVTVETRAQVTYSSGLPIIEYGDPVSVSGVLVSRETVDDAENLRPFGVRESVSLAFPRSCVLDLRGARVTIGDDVFYVSGAPEHEQSPLERFDLVVEAERGDG